MRRILAAGAALALAVAAASAPHYGSAQSATGWPTFHGDIARDGISSASAPTGNNGVGTVVNRFQLGTAMDDSPAVDAIGNAYIGDNGGHFYAFSGKPTAGPLWTFPSSGKVGEIHGSPTLSLDGSRVFFGSDDGHVYALKTSDGTQVWTVNLNGPTHASPLLSRDGSTIYVPTSAGSVYALHTSDGSVAWGPYSPNGAIPTSLAASPDGATLYIPFANGQIYAVPSGGPVSGGVSVYYLGSAPTGTPAIDPNGNIYVATREGRMLSFNPGSNTPRTGWNRLINGSGAFSVTSPGFGSGLAVFGASDSYVHAWNSSSGDQSWQFLTGQPVGSSPAIATGNNEIIVGSDDGYVYALGVDGHVIWKTYTGAGVEGSPAIASDGSIWVGTLGGSVYHIADLPQPATPPGTPTALPATATPTITSTPTPTATATATSTPVQVPLSISDVAQVNPGQMQKISITSAPNTLVKIRIEYPNGDHQSGRATTDAGGKATYSFKQGGSKVKHNNSTATITATAGTGSSQHVVTATYKIGWGTIDLSAEPRSVAVGKVVDIFVHAKPRSKVDVFIVTPSGRFIRLNEGKTGPKGFASFKYTVPKGLVSGHNVKVTVLAKFASGNPSATTKTTFTIT
jgi:outer membrane protein assembly factor BamB